MMVALKFSPLHFRHVLSKARAVLSVDDQKEVLPPSVMRCFDGAAGRAARHLSTPGKRCRTLATRFAPTKRVSSLAVSPLAIAAPRPPALRTGADCDAAAPQTRRACHRADRLIATGAFAD